MDSFWQVVGGGGILLGVAGLITAFATRRRDKNTNTQESLKSNIELNKYLDGVVAAALVSPLAEIAALKSAIGRLTEREQTTKSILRGFFQRLLWWDERGRPGDMPMPSRADMTTLDLSDIESDTQSAAEVAEAVRRANL